MSLNSLRHLLSETGRSLRKNAWMALASVSTVTISLFVLAVFVVVSVNVNHVTQILESQVEMRVFIKPHVSHSTEMALYHQAKTWPQVRRIDYFTKKQAAQSLKNEFPDQQDLFQVIQKSNPLFDGFDVYTKSPRQIPALANRLSKNPIVHNVVYQGTVVRRLTRLGNVLKWSGWVVEALLAVATLLIIVNTIRLAVFARRREIQVMRLVGATDWFIRWPFILEGLVIGVVGAAAADVMVGAGYRWILNRAAVSLPFWPMAGWHSVVDQTTLFTVLGGLIVGAIASMIAVRRFLRI